MIKNRFNFCKSIFVNQISNNVHSVTGCMCTCTMISEIRNIRTVERLVRNNQSTKSVRKFCVLQHVICIHTAIIFYQHQLTNVGCHFNRLKYWLVTNYNVLVSSVGYVQWFVHAILLSVQWFVTYPTDFFFCSIKRKLFAFKLKITECIHHTTILNGPILQYYSSVIIINDSISYGTSLFNCFNKLRLMVTCDNTQFLDHYLLIGYLLMEVCITELYNNDE